MSDNWLDINGDILSSTTGLFASIFNLTLFLDLIRGTSKSKIAIPIFYQIYFSIILFLLFCFIFDLWLLLLVCFRYMRQICYTFFFVNLWITNFMNRCIDVCSLWISLLGFSLQDKQFIFRFERFYIPKNSLVISYICII